MRILVPLVVLFYSLNTIAHGSHMATQKLTFSESNIELEFKINVNTLEHFSTNIFEVNYKLKKGIVLTNYINSKFKIDKNLTFELVSSQQNEDFFILKLTTTWDTKKYNSIEITSNLFYEVDHHFQNRLIIEDTDGSVSSYRLNKINNKTNYKFK